jgi:hypothetical protein
MPSCGHEDWPCCGCGDDVETFDEADLCQGCGEPEAFCRCDDVDEYDDDCDGDETDCDGDDGMDGDHETALRDAGWGVDEDYMPGGDGDFDGDW